LGCDVWFEHTLKVRWCSSPCCSIGKHQGLEDDEIFDWNPVECLEEWGDMGENRKIVYRLQGIDGEVGSPANRE
jgi:hypothetical protein